MTRQPHRVDPERDRRLAQLQTAALVVMALGVAILVYLAIATTR